MDTSVHHIEFNADGVCSYCAAYEAAVLELPPESQRSQELERIISEVRAGGRGKDYDCVLGVSGGVDSSYLACVLRDHQLRVLAVQFDNGWNTELAVKNIELLCRKLKMDLSTYVVDWEEFRDLQLAFFRSGVANLEAPSDHGIFAALYKVADKYGIKAIMNGNNVATEQISVPAYGYTYADVGHLRAIHARYGSRRLKTFPQMGLLKLLFYRKIKGIRPYNLLNYVPYSRRQAIERLERDIGWRDYGGKHQESIITRFHQGYILPKKYKLDKRRAHLSNLIYSGQISRDEALKVLQEPPYPPAVMEQDAEYVIKKLGITSEEFEQIMAEPPKSYRDYPNEEWLYKLYSGIVNARRNVRQAVSGIAQA